MKINVDNIYNYQQSRRQNYCIKEKDVSDQVSAAQKKLQYVISSSCESDDAGQALQDWFCQAAHSGF